MRRVVPSDHPIVAGSVEKDGAVIHRFVKKVTDQAGIALGLS